MTKDFHCCNCCMDSGGGSSGFGFGGADDDDDGEWITPPNPYFCEVCPEHEYGILSDDVGNFQSVGNNLLLPV